MRFNNNKMESSARSIFYYSFSSILPLIRWYTKKWTDCDRNHINRPHEQPKEEEDKISIIVISNTIAHPWTIMIHMEYASARYTVQTY